MAEYSKTTAVLDINVFDFAYHIANTVPTLHKVIVDPLHKKIMAGQSVPVSCQIMDVHSIPGRRFLFNLTQMPTITLYNPLNERMFPPIYMFQSSVGTYSYIFNTSALPTGPFDRSVFDEDVDFDVTQSTFVYIPGAYSAVFTAVNGTVYMKTAKHVVFTVLDEVH